MRLAHRQYQVAELVAQGLADKEIAARLGLDTGTVKIHVAAARRNAGARNRVQLAVMFVRGEVHGPRPMEAA
jgi:two-component system, NarL family, nitrate/nitrite response regulator NarL